MSKEWCGRYRANERLLDTLEIGTLRARSSLGMCSRKEIFTTAPETHYGAREMVGGSSWTV